MRHNINIIFKKHARSHFHNGMHRKLGRSAACLHFPSRRPYFRLQEDLEQNAEKGLLSARDDTAEIVLPLSFPPRA